MSVYVTMWPDVGLARLVTMIVQHLVAIQSSLSAPPSFTIDRTHPLQVRSSRELSRSLFFSEKQLLYFTDFSTLAQICQPPDVSPCACVLAYFYKYFSRVLVLH
jgi:hypothetical protein